MKRLDVIQRWLLFAGLVGGSLCTYRACAQSQRIHVPLTPDHWHALAPSPGAAKPDVQFAGHEGFPQGVLVIKAGTAELNDFTFRDGTIEFDIKPIGENIPGIQFRVHGTRFKQNGEEFYIRNAPDCRASNDCIQYTPLVNGSLLWNTYPQYQTQAMILDGWNHVKLVVSGRRMNVYVNGLPRPALEVGSLDGSSTEGALELRGPAYYANLTIRAGATEGLAATALPDPTLDDHGMVRHWHLGSLTSYRKGVQPVYSDMPLRAGAWRSIEAERFGIVNLNRVFPLSFEPPPLTWLRTNIVSDRDQTKRIALGWIGRVWVYLNGRLLTQGENLYDNEGRRRSPDGRLSLENGGFDMPLQKGKNEIVIALVSTLEEDPVPNRYGWGLMMQFKDKVGITFN